MPPVPKPVKQEKSRPYNSLQRKQKPKKTIMPWRQNIIDHKRIKKTAKQRGNIPASADKEAKERANGACERCGWVEGSYDPTGHRWGLQRAHLERRWQLETTTGKDIAMLCGPSVNSGTCHHWVDYTAAGKEWAREYRKKLWGGE